MKGSKSFVAITIAATLVITPAAIASQKTTSKAAGRATTVVNTILSGNGSPAKSIGIDGDFYIDIKNANLYGPKLKGAWKIATTLKQSESKSVATTSGSQGATGAQGEKGDKGAQGEKGSQGVAGVAGAIGLTGATGPAGPAGATGAPGANGSNGATGPAGATGNAGANGSNGAAGAKGDTGATGSAGAAGAKGDTGAPGADGVSISYFVDLGTWSLSTSQSVGTSDSNSFGNLGVGSYTFEILVDGTFSPTTLASMTIGMQVVASAGSLDYRVFSSDSSAYINGYGNRHYEFLIIGRIICTGATTLKLRAIDQFGATSGNMLNFSGRALINKVGTVG